MRGRTDHVDKILSRKNVRVTGLDGPTSVREKNKQLFPGQNAWILPCFFRFYCHVFDPEYKFLPSTFFDRRARSAKGRGRKLFFFRSGETCHFFALEKLVFFLPRKKLFFHLHFIDPLSAWRLFKSWCPRKLICSFCSIEQGNMNVSANKKV